MSDDLVKRLRDFTETDREKIDDVREDAADYIVYAAERLGQLERELSISRMAQVVMDNTVAEAEALMEDNARLREALNQSRLAFSGYVSVQSAIDMIDRAVLKGETT